MTLGEERRECLFYVPPHLNTVASSLTLRLGWSPHNSLPSPEAWAAGFRLLCSKQSEDGTGPGTRFLLQGLPLSARHPEYKGTEGPACLSVLSSSPTSSSFPVYLRLDCVG